MLRQASKSAWLSGRLADWDEAVGAASAAASDKTMSLMDASWNGLLLGGRESRHEIALDLGEAREAGDDPALHRRRVVGPRVEAERVVHALQRGVEVVGLDARVDEDPVVGVVQIGRAHV